MRVGVLLRGVNVGGNRVIKMAELREALVHAGVDVIATVLQSGNLVVDADSPADAAQRVEAAIEAAFGVTVRCVGATKGQLDAALDSPVWPDDGNPSWMMTVFSDEPATANPAPRRDLPVLADGRVALGDAQGLPVVWHYCDGGISKNPETTWFVDYPAGAVSTARNRNTILKLLLQM